MQQINAKYKNEALFSKIASDLIPEAKVISLVETPAEVSIAA